MSYYTTGSGSIMLRIPSDTARRQLYDDLLGRYDRLCSEEMSQCGEQMAKSVQGEYQRRKCQMKRYDDPLWWLTTVLNDVGFVELERGMETDDFFIEMTYSGNYDERTVMDVLDMLVPYTQEGCISYIGEDNTYWRHQFVDGVWVKLRGQICYETPEQCRCQTFPQTHANLERLISEIRRHAIYDNRPYEKKARVLLEAYDQMDPDGVLLALTGRRLYEHEAAAGLWKEDKQEDKPCGGVSMIPPGLFPQPRRPVCARPVSAAQPRRKKRRKTGGILAFSVWEMGSLSATGWG